MGHPRLPFRTLLSGHSGAPGISKLAVTNSGSRKRGAVTLSQL